MISLDLYLISFNTSGTEDEHGFGLCRLRLLFMNRWQQGHHQNTQGQETSVVLGNVYLLKQ